MRELALHILDIAQNSVAAGARHIWLTIRENEQGYFVFSVRDDGKGMDSEMLQRVRDPFVTSRTTRKVGMGIPFIRSWSWNLPITAPTARWCSERRRSEKY